ncbi:alpha/beta hydrolase [Babesia caballi]|uniref:Alpha/beta hydrolase n=1 Tax=Babesia caballi TaxID=5871 RepID=A0AAV4LSV0_BABCB|nr:alpha/beta hydrolase [Babesia caballi]
MQHQDGDPAEHWQTGRPRRRRALETSNGLPGVHLVVLNNTRIVHHLTTPKLGGRRAASPLQPGNGRPRQRLQQTVEKDHRLTVGHKYQHLFPARRVLEQQRHQAYELVLALDQHVLVGQRRRQRQDVVIDPDRLPVGSQAEVRQLVHCVRQRRRRHHRLQPADCLHAPRSAEELVYPPDLDLEAHVQQSVRLVQHEHLDVRDVERGGALAVVEHPPRRAHQHRDSLADLRLLRLAAIAP